MLRRLLSAFLFSVLTLAWPVSIHAASSSLVISEIQTGSATSASTEFVELQNISESPIDINGWLLEYKSATSPNTPGAWVKHAGVSGTIAPGAYFLVATKSSIAGAGAVWTDGMASTGGHVRLVDNHGAVIDAVGYGNANSAENTPAALPAAGKSISRALEAGLSVDTDNNLEDFEPASTPSPGKAAAATVSASPTGTLQPSPGPKPAGGTSTAAPAADSDFSAISITELFVDPAAPLTDAHDEFIELHNSSDVDVNIAGLKLQCGSNFHDSYTLPSTIVPAGGYTVVYSTATKLALTNSGGSARLMTASGSVVDVTEAYTAAPSGQSWSSFDDGWHWTTTPTAGSANVLTSPVVSPKASAKASTATAQDKAIASKASTAKVSSPARTSTSRVAAAAKIAKAATKVTKPFSAASAALAENPGAASNGRWLLAGLAGLTIGYGLYEYRHHIYNFIEISKRYLRARRNPS